jgi:hypothetical protein
VRLFAARISHRGQEFPCGQDRNRRGKVLSHRALFRHEQTRRHPDHDEEWSNFLSDEVTARFPDGFTVVDGYGQWKNKEGKIVKEKSKVLIVLYKKAELKAASAKLDEIRTAYNKAFQQQSVLRMDIVQTVRVSF